MNLFEGKVMGVPKRTEEEILEEAQMKKDVLGGRSAALQPLDFNNKIMGGRQMSKTEENLPSLGGAGDYQERLGSLLGTSGGKGKKVKDIPSEILGGFGGGDKVSGLLGNGGSLDPKLKAESMLGLGVSTPKGKSKKGKSPANITDDILGGFGGSPNNKVNAMLGAGPGNFANVGNMFSPQKQKGKAPNPVAKVNNMFAQPKLAKSNPFKNGYSTPLNVSSMLGFGDKPTKVKQGNQQDVFDIKKILGNTGESMSFGNGFNTKDKINNMLGGSLQLGANKPKVGSQAKQFSQSVNVETFLPKFGPQVGTTKGKTLGKEWAVPDFRNPANVGFERANQQVGLAMFGDYDGDGLKNVVDCDPRDKTEQGFFEKVKNTFTKGRFANDDEVAKEEASEANTDALLAGQQSLEVVPMQEEQTDEPEKSSALTQFKEYAAERLGNAKKNISRKANEVGEELGEVKDFFVGQTVNKVKDNYEIAQTKRDITKTDLALAQQAQGFETKIVSNWMRGQQTPGLMNSQIAEDFQRDLLNTPPEGRRRLAMQYETELAKARIDAKAKVQVADAMAEAGYSPNVNAKGETIWGSGKTATGKKATRAARKAAQSFSAQGNTALGGANEKGNLMAGMIGTSSGGLNQNAELLTGVNKGSGAVSQMNLNSIASIGNSQMNDFKMNQAAALGSGGGGNAGLAQMSALGGSVGQGGDFAYRVAESLGESASSKSGFVTPQQDRDGVDVVSRGPVELPTPQPRPQQPQYAPTPVAQTQPVFVQPQTPQPATGYGDAPQADLREQYAVARPDKPPLPDGRVWSPRSKKYVRYPRGPYDKRSE